MNDNPKNNDNKNEIGSETLIRATAVLYALKNKKTDAIFKITTKATVGRQKTCDIELADKHISRLHASLNLSGIALTLTHHGSNNGTFVNGEKIQECVLKISDIVTFDTHEFEVISLTSESTVLDFENEQTLPNQDSANTLFLPEAWADAKEKSTNTSKKGKAPTENNETIAKVSSAEVPLSHKPKTKMNTLLSTQVLFTEEANEKNKALNSDLEKLSEGDTVHLFGYHQSIHDEVFALDKKILYLGKSSKNDIVLKDASVSSKHASLSNKKNNWLLEDLDSTNGTFVNGHQIKEATLLKRGDLIQFGLIQLVFGQLKPRIKESLISRIKKWLA